MTCPTILLKPVIRTEEAEPFGDLTVHWDEPVTAFAVVMLGGHDVRVADYDEDGHATDDRLNLRSLLAATIAAHAGLSDVQRAALATAATDDDGRSGPGAVLPLADALAVHRAVLRWAHEAYADWAQRMAGDLDPWQQAA